MKTFQFQNLKQTNYFEGWYFRFTNDVSNYAIIFALTKNKKDPHAFIQVFHENSNKSSYHRFPVEAFQSEENIMRIDQNHISTESIYINTDSIQLDITFKDSIPLINIHSNHSAMGYMNKMPLECFQEVIYLDGTGTGLLNGNQVQGKIYMEKTYGSKFPVKWVWIQSSHSKKQSLLSFSVGKIPFLFLQIKGFLLVLKTTYKNYHFYTGNLSRVQVHSNQIIVSKGKTKIIIHVHPDHLVTLVGPSQKAVMDLDVFESLTATASIQIYERNKLVFEDDFTKVGYEQMY